ncbi:YncE family protein [Hamadaea tsunoensis]|uniref:YncE family protein n=1 Tax=Hamadaea tsunoensis TaxID=53368 RepID=UPI00042320F3|nr:beta-propeller fold lactonase family protein [Hamadaea tsunoensis]
MRRLTTLFALAAALPLAALPAACSKPADRAPNTAVAVSVAPSPSPSPSGPFNVYAAAEAGRIRPDVAQDKALIYVPDTLSDDVYVIDPATYKIVDHFAGGGEPQHIVPSYDMRTLYVTASRVPGGSVRPIDPRTGKPGKIIPVEDVYNLYFTPGGKYAWVVAEAYQRLDFYDPTTWKRVKSVHFPACAGINHMDFSADEKIALVSCEFANRMMVIDVATGNLIREIPLDVVADGMPQDTRLLPDGSAFFTADMHANGVYVFDNQAHKRTGFIPTGAGAHGIYFSRDGKRVFVSNRDEGTISVIDVATRKPVTKWVIPGGGSPDMGGVSADGKTLWLAGRYNGEVYAFDTTTGHLKARIPVGDGPHGLLVWPQPGRYSLGHTSNIR